MDNEVLQLLRAGNRQRTFFEQQKVKIKYALLSQQDIAKMRKELILNVKPYYVAWRKKGKDEIDAYALEIFEQRIATLDKKNVVLLYNYMKTFLQVKSQEAKELTLFSLMVAVDLSYGQGGWFIRQMGKAVRQGKLSQMDVARRLLKV